MGNLNLGQKLIEKFPGDDYFRSFKEGPGMEVEEQNNSPIYRRFHVLFDDKRRHVVRICSVTNFSFPYEVRDSLVDKRLFEELEELIHKDQVNAVIFIS